MRKILGLFRSGLCFLILFCFLYSFAFADSLIIDKQTRIIMRITSNDPPEYDSANEEAIKVADHLNIGSGMKKLSVDGKTFAAITEQDKTNLIYRLNPGVKTRIDLTALIDSYIASPTPQGLRDIILKLKDLYKVDKLPELN